ncbi:hypothetical protein ACFC6L_26830 [Kitasatospora phosalacinea]|uniref:hypothetical protein n=1 Tax=Kitasatospora phosalacinea TaxID=2065 RepID=UPI0035DA6D25
MLVRDDPHRERPAGDVDGLGDGLGEAAAAGVAVEQLGFPAQQFDQSANQAVGSRQPVHPDPAAGPDGGAAPANPVAGTALSASAGAL